MFRTAVLILIVFQSLPREVFGQSGRGLDRGTGKTIEEKIFWALITILAIVVYFWYQSRNRKKALSELEIEPNGFANFLEQVGEVCLVVPEFGQPTVFHKPVVSITDLREIKIYSDEEASKLGKVSSVIEFSISDVKRIQISGKSVSHYFSSFMRNSIKIEREKQPVIEIAFEHGKLQDEKAVKLVKHFQKLIDHDKEMDNTLTL